MDPLAEKYYSISPYAYCANNPMRRVDPNGEDWRDVLNGIGNGFVNAAKATAHVITHPVETVSNKVNQFANAAPGEQLQMVGEMALDMATGGGYSYNKPLVEGLVTDIVQGGNGSATGEALGGQAFQASVAIGTAKAGEGISKGISKLSSTVGKAGNAVAANGTKILSKSDALRIENAATRIDKPINVVGSRAAGTAKAGSDWDYVIKGVNSKDWGKIKNSLPGAKSIMDNTPRNIDLIKTPLDRTKPYITINPRTK